MKIQEYRSPEDALIVMKMVLAELDKVACSRYSSNLVNQLVYTPYQGMNCLYQFVIPEIAHLENDFLPTQTVEEDAFTRNTEMRGLYKKHFYIPQFAAKNLQNSWGLHKSSKSKVFCEAFEEQIKAYYAAPSEEGARILSSDIPNAMFNELRDRPKTGEYIVYQKYNEKNYYLCLGFHKQDTEILSWVKDSYKKDFPFLKDARSQLQ